MRGICRYAAKYGLLGVADAHKYGVGAGVAAIVGGGPGVLGGAVTVVVVELGDDQTGGDTGGAVVVGRYVVLVESRIAAALVFEGFTVCHTAQCSGGRHQGRLGLINLGNALAGVYGIAAAVGGGPGARGDALTAVGTFRFVKTELRQGGTVVLYRYLRQGGQRLVAGDGHVGGHAHDDGGRVVGDRDGLGGAFGIAADIGSGPGARHRGTVADGASNGLGVNDGEVARAGIVGGHDGRCAGCGTADRFVGGYAGQNGAFSIGHVDELNVVGAVATCVGSGPGTRQAVVAGAIQIGALLGEVHGHVGVALIGDSNRRGGGHAAALGGGIDRRAQQLGRFGVANDDGEGNGRNIAAGIGGAPAAVHRSDLPGSQTIESLSEALHEFQCGLGGAIVGSGGGVDIHREAAIAFHVDDIAVFEAL